MNFRTEIKTKPQKTNQINYNAKVLLIGSCFTNNIGLKLAKFKFNTLINPFGVIFNPKAIENLVTRSIDNTFFTDKDLVFQNERWHCLDVHSNFSDTDKNTVLENINKAILNTKTVLENASHIIITLGTSWVYRYHKTDSLVANCHKIPQTNFTKELLSIDEIQQSLKNIITAVTSVNKNINIVFTLSPVRHLKDGFIENQLSKAHLISAIHQVLDTKTHYFPAYEIMMDDLRDYRFYKKDMIHPNEIAIDYIWNKFIETWIHPSEKENLEQVKQINNSLAHKPFNENSEQHQLFLEKLHQKISDLEKTKGISFS